MQEAIDGVNKGFQLFKEFQDMPSEHFFNGIITFQNKLVNYNRALEGTISEISAIFLLNHYNAWLKKFNNKFLLQYE